MDKSDLVSYALNFVSFLVKQVKTDKVILFGSVASGEFDEKSDIDLFIETDQPKNKIDRILEVYGKSEDNEKYRLKGIKNEIRIKIGKLDEWESLKRSIISNGLILYGKYIDAPKNLKPYLLFTLLMGKSIRNKKMRVWRRIYGYRQKVGKRVYEMNGIACRKIGRGSFAVPIDRNDEVVGLLKREKISYEVYEIWSEKL